MNDTLQRTEMIDAATRLVNCTSSHIFLTGKAGTGKTTFLKNLNTHKNFIVVAPTGIAALNAGGVTIHSQFLFPFGMYIPGKNSRDLFEEEIGGYTSDMLARKHPLNRERRNVLKSIELLVIDEVSMLRCDLLDAIDYRLKAARRNFGQSFGGVQLLLIGDPYQLPPVVVPKDREPFHRHYTSPWFFESRALKGDGFAYIELDRIFRQQDSAFIGLLNNLRHNTLTSEDISELNRHCLPEQAIRNIGEVITLTTHNDKADEINSRALHALEAPSHFAHAGITGDFPEGMYPVQEHLELKAGAQIMFVKNDSEAKMYYNGKLATVRSIEGDDITVEMEDTRDEYMLRKETWENKRYSVDADSRRIDEEVIGTFEQYPVRLAWAITIHKSQGLTFTRAVIDAGKAFADGQVYVALSRLRSLDGLIMRTPVNPAVVNTDNRVVAFEGEYNRPGELAQVMDRKQQEYVVQMLESTFDFSRLAAEHRDIRKNIKVSFDSETMKPVPEQIAEALVKERVNTVKFRRQLRRLLEHGDRDLLLARLGKGCAYYRALLIAQEKVLLTHLEEMKRHKRVKTYAQALGDLDMLLSGKIMELDKIGHVVGAVLRGENPDNMEWVSKDRAAERAGLQGEIRKLLPAPMKKPKKGDTYRETLLLFRSGAGVEKIAAQRSLTTGTIEGHLARLVGEGLVAVHEFMDKADIEEIKVAIGAMRTDFTAKDVFSRLEGKYSYGKIHAVQNSLRKDK